MADETQKVFLRPRSALQGDKEGRREAGDSSPLQMSNNIREALAKRADPMERIQVLEFYQMLINNIQAVADRKADPLPQVVALLQKVELDLKDALSTLEPDVREKTTLRILRDKLIRRVSEVTDREEKLQSAEKLLTKPPDILIQDKVGVPSSLSDVLWNEAINQTPKKPNLIKLKNIYDDVLIQKFINLLAMEKGKIIGKFKKQYEGTVHAMKKELQKNVSEAVNEYIAAREEWSEVSDLLECVQNLHMRYLLHNSGSVRDDQKHMQVIESLIQQLKESQSNYEGEIQRGEDLHMQLVAEHQNNNLLSFIATSTMQQLQSDHDELCNLIQELEAEIKLQRQGIDELQTHLAD